MTENSNENVIVEERTDTDKELKEPPMFKVILLNDDYTSMEFVVMILQHVFGKSREEATMIMLNVHRQGSGLAGVYTRDVAETKVSITHSLARENQFPLKAIVEEG